MLEEASPYGPITIHYDLDVGLGNSLRIDLERIKHLKEVTLTPHINTHLVSPRSFDIESFHEREKINALWREEIQVMTSYFGSSSVALEHFPFTESMPHIRYPADSQVFAKVIEDTGCMLLLDLAHARISAKSLDVDVKDYISALPLDRLVEMHITGIKTHNGVLTDHFELGDEDWDLFYWALDKIQSDEWRKPEIIAFEYGGVGEVFIWRTNIHKLRLQVPIMYNAIHRVD
jgi:hypothetical protein